MLILTIVLILICAVAVAISILCGDACDNTPGVIMLCAIMIGYFYLSAKLVKWFIFSLEILK